MARPIWRGPADGVSLFASGSSRASGAASPGLRRPGVFLRALGQPAECPLARVRSGLRSLDAPTIAH
jgi:hypothetical protein